MLDTLDLVPFSEYTEIKHRQGVKEYSSQANTMAGAVGIAFQLLVGAVLIILIGLLSFYSLFILYQRRKYGHIPIPEPIG